MDSHAQALFSDLPIPSIRVTDATTFVVLVVLSCTARIFLEVRDYIIQMVIPEFNTSTHIEIFGIMI